VGGRAELDGKVTENRFSDLNGRMELPGDSAVAGRHSSRTEFPSSIYGETNARLSAVGGNGETMNNTKSLVDRTQEIARSTPFKQPLVELPVP